MTTSSVNSIMIGIAICDFLSMANIIRVEFETIDPMGTECTPPPSLSRVNFDWFLTSIHNGLRRCSSWLGVLIALVRYLVIKHVLNYRIAQPRFGFILTFISFFLSCFFSVLFYSQFHFDQISTWHPNPSCTEYSSEWSEPVYGQLCNKLYEMQEGLFHRIQLVVEAVIGKLIPCVLLPILTGLLICNLKTFNKNIGTEVFADVRHIRAHQNERITSVVIFIAITYIITELPLGIVYIVDAIWHNDSNLQWIFFLIYE
ncbi:hypothetical protein GCK72_019559 [Caenorhabditis remanei]|uniref:G-protein coupled receptors family 1 profile domain-containing protein n=1 Tax=Caenorhabditis remanei TaxID=31234 RepID=A0A6A5GE41_CAERE|nr:hypothetical protein GCK72_019559 [Caenorhabditis remanei]KAF1753004.1 hypothetical protein GCK72_019559 [Caenorhabditis remanei]